jgi:splicing factor U2AF subunit
LAFDPAALADALTVANGMVDGSANPTAVSMLLMQQMQAANPQATRQARRLYIGNMPTGLGLTEAMLQEFFNTTVISMGVLTPQPVMSVWISAEGNFCFVEFRAIKDATACLALLQGLTLGGRALKIGRPSDYKAPPPHLENFIVGLPSDSYKPPAPSGSGPVGLLGLNLPTPILNFASAPGQQNHALGLTMPVFSPPGLTYEAAQLGLSSEPPTEVLMLVNMVTEAELGVDEDFEDIVLDVREECEKYGELLEVVIPRPSGDGPDTKLSGGRDSGPRIGVAVGRIFARFANVESCAQARNALDGRTFNSNRVDASFYDLAKFQAHQYA